VEEKDDSMDVSILIMGLVFFGITPASRHVNDDQPGLLNVHIATIAIRQFRGDRLRPHDYSCFGRSNHLFWFFRRNSVPINPSGRGDSFPIEPTLKRASASCSRISEGKHIHLRACENSVAICRSAERRIRQSCSGARVCADE